MDVEENLCGNSKPDGDKHSVEPIMSSFKRPPTEYSLIKEAGFYFNYESDEASLENLEPNNKHTILFDHISYKCTDHVGPPRPLPKENYVDKWDDYHVKMPFSDSNVDRKGNKRWHEITRCLNLLATVLKDDPDSQHLENAIKQFNAKYSSSWDFDALHTFFERRLNETESRRTLREVVPKMIKLALDLPEKIRKAIPLLKQGRPHSITLSQEQCACILANAFFCTFPMRNAATNPKELPFINFSSLYYQNGKNSTKLEKLKCIFHYFERVTTKMPEGLITFKRQYLRDDQIPDFKVSTKRLRKCLLLLDGTIEDCAGTLQLDFANKFLGGGVLNSGCVQEEIRFVICPELIVSMLFTEYLETNETVVIKGCERFSSYTGYASSFKWNGNYNDETPRDGWNRLFTHVLAMDALFIRSYYTQFQETKTCRELKKAYSGYTHNTDEYGEFKVDAKKYPAISTGNWGCGAFNGDKELKFLIQMMAASEANRDLIYFTFNCSETTRKLTKLYELVEKAKLNVSQIYEMILDYTICLKNSTSGRATAAASSSNLDNYTLLQYFEEKLNK